MELVSLLTFFIFLFLPPTLTAGDQFNILDFGAMPDGATDSSGALLAAWEAACNDVNSSSLTILYVPQGRYLVGNALIFHGQNCNIMKDNNNKGIVLRIDGMLVAPDDYATLGDKVFWLSFVSVVNVTVSGGLLDGKGAGLWACKTDVVEKRECPSGTTTLGFTNSKDILISGLNSVNSQLYHIAINNCTNVKLQGLSISASSESPNTDGIHVQYSSNVTIFDTRIGTGDDCVSVGPGTIGLSIYNVVCGPGHGISIGSLGKQLEEAGVENVTVTSITFINTQNGVRIKSWGRPSNGFVRNVIFQMITMQNVQNPIIIDQNYCPNHIDCPGQDSGIKISNVTYRDIQGTSATLIAIKLDCSSKYPCTNLRMENVRLTYKDQLGLSSCANANGTIADIYC